MVTASTPSVIHACLLMSMSSSFDMVLMTWFCIVTLFPIQYALFIQATLRYRVPYALPLTNLINLIPFRS